MTFSRNFHTLIEDSNKDFIKISFNKGINLTRYNPNNSALKSKIISNKASSFSTASFDIDSDNNIYGVMVDYKHTLTYLCISNNVVFKSKLLSFDSEKYRVSFPYIKKIKKVTHLFYYLINIKKPNVCKLIHYYNNGSGWKHHKLDKINYFVLTNFIVLWNSNSPEILYLNNVNGFSELFLLKFNTNNNNWSSPIQITNTKKTKVYLSALTDESNSYHIVYCENNNDKYYCTYTCGSIKNNTFDTIKNTVIKDGVACEFPTISLIENTLYCQWIEYSNLYTSKANIENLNWSKAKLINTYKMPSFSGLLYKSSNSNFKVNNFFAYDNEFTPLGLSNLFNSSKN